MRTRRLLYIVFGLCALGAPAMADTMLPATLKDDYATQVRVAGSGILVGLALGPLSGHHADPRDLRIPLTGLVERTPVCVTANTRDGQYWSEALLDVPANAGPFGILEPKPDWRFRDQLKHYDRSSFAVVGRYGKNCEIDPTADYLPVVYEGSATTLTAAINSQRAIETSAHLLVAGRLSQAGRCVPVDPNVRAIAFDVVCSFNLAGVASEPALATLELRRSQRTGQRTDTFRIRLP